MNSNAININFDGPTMSVPIEVVKDLTAHGEWILVAIFEQETTVEEVMTQASQHGVFLRLSDFDQYPASHSQIYGQPGWGRPPPTSKIRRQFAIVGRSKDVATLVMHNKCSDAQSKAALLEASIDRLYSDVAKARSTAIEQETPDTAAKLYDAVLGLIDQLRKKTKP